MMHVDPVRLRRGERGWREGGCQSAEKKVPTPAHACLVHGLSSWFVVVVRRTRLSGAWLVRVHARWLGHNVDRDECDEAIIDSGKIAVSRHDGTVWYNSRLVKRRGSLVAIGPDRIKP